MIPRTFPSIIEALQTKMVVYVLPSITGLTAWIDYIPVKGVTTESNALANTYAIDGYQVVKTIESLTGQQAWLDYIPVFESAAYNKPWSTDAGGYIPAGGLFSVASLFAAGEQGTWYDPSDVNLNWRYNLLTYTEQFDNAVWTKTNVTVTANTAIAPDGTLTADRAVGSAGTNTIFEQTLFTSLGANTPYTFSVWLKSNTGASQTVRLKNTHAGVVNNFSGDQTVTTQWQLFTLSVTNGPSAGTGQIVGLTSNTSFDAYDLLVWGAQLQTGSVATTYQQIVTPEISYLNYQPQPVLFQDSAGTTPVTAVQQPVGLMLDKSKGLVLGPELVTNGGPFANTTGWLGFTTITASSGLLVATSTGANDLFGTWLGTPGTLAENKYFQITTTITALTGRVRFQIYGSNSVGPWITAPGTYTIRLYQTSANGNVGLNTDQATSISLSSFSIKQVTGNHAFQTTSASRPVLSARYNLLTKTEVFSDAAWTKTAVNTTGTPPWINVTVSPDGTTTADKLIEDATSSGHSVFQSIAVTSGTAYTMSCYLKKSERDFGWLKFSDGTTNWGRTFNLATGQVGNAVSGFTAPTTSTITDVGNGWYLCTISVTAGATGTGGQDVGVMATNGTRVYLGNGTSGIFIWGADLRVSNDALSQPAYQRVNTSSDYDTVGFKPYLAFDGVDDSLVTNSIDFTSTDKMTVFAGVRKLSDAVGFGVLAEFGNRSILIDGAWTLHAPETGGTGTYLMASRGTLTVNIGTTNTFAAPITNVITGIADISGDQVLLRVNGTQAAISTADQGTGNYGNYPLFIGRRNNASLPFNGRLYSLIVRGAASTTAQITSTEGWVNQRTGAYT